MLSLFKENLEQKNKEREICELVASKLKNFKNNQEFVESVFHNFGIYLKTPDVIKELEDSDIVELVNLKNEVLMVNQVWLKNAELPYSDIIHKNIHDVIGRVENAGISSFVEQFTAKAEIIFNTLKNNISRNVFRPHYVYLKSNNKRFKYENKWVVPVYSSHLNNKLTGFMVAGKISSPAIRIIN